VHDRPHLTGGPLPPKVPVAPIKPPIPGGRGWGRFAGEGSTVLSERGIGLDGGPAVKDWQAGFGADVVRGTGG
jgi:hypothetical protein